MTKQPGGFDEILLLEDNRSTAERIESAERGRRGAGLPITVRLHRISDTGRGVVRTMVYETNRAKPRLRAEIVLALLDGAPSPSAKSVVVAGTSFGSSKQVLSALCDLQLPFVVEILPSTAVATLIGGPRLRRAADLMGRGIWKALNVRSPDGDELSYRAARLSTVKLPVGLGSLFAAQVGGIDGVHRGTSFGVSSFRAPIAQLVQLVANGQWTRLAARRAKREAEPASGAKPLGSASSIRARANISVARRQDAQVQRYARDACRLRFDATGRLLRQTNILNVVELFAGAGGMGLGFLLADDPRGRFRIIYSGEADPICIETLRKNHRFFDCSISSNEQERTPSETTSVDLREESAFDEIDAVTRENGGTHVVIGGPPCQGFSTANRNSWSSRNPNNELIEVFVRYVERLRPLVFLMENVQGILWTQDARGGASIVDMIERRLDTAGYWFFPTILDAAWYGVPQYRARFFLMGLHKDLGYVQDDFGVYGPFPQPSHGPCLEPLITVRDAIGDLPQIGNGCSLEQIGYSEPIDGTTENDFLPYLRRGSQQGVILDHVTSRHADYVIKRYRMIPPGGNWENIRESLTNYANVHRTHSNIYRRLHWGEPSITIGHYRKSMLIHPSQHRGLSLREAMRLQSFPDWYQFAGTKNGGSGGLMHKQQQLANAVCPLVTKAIAEHILAL